MSLFCSSIPSRIPHSIGSSYLLRPPWLGEFLKIVLFLVTLPIGSISQLLCRRSLNQNFSDDFLRGRLECLGEEDHWQEVPFTSYHMCMCFTRLIAVDGNLNQLSEIVRFFLSSFSTVTLTTIQSSTLYCLEGNHQCGLLLRSRRQAPRSTDFRGKCLYQLLTTLLQTIFIYFPSFMYFFPTIYLYQYGLWVIVQCYLILLFKSFQLLPLVSLLISFCVSWPYSHNYFSTLALQNVPGLYCIFSAPVLEYGLLQGQIFLLLGCH